MEVIAAKDKVSGLLQNAAAFRGFRAERRRVLRDDQISAIERVSAAVDSNPGNTVQVEQADLAIVHSLSDAYEKICCGRFRKLFQVHCVAAYLAVATPILFYDFVTLIAAPFVVPVYFFLLVPIDALITRAAGNRLFGNDAIMFWIATHLMVRYAAFAGPSYFIARDFRYREFTVPPYIVTGILLLGWPLYKYWKWATER